MDHQERKELKKKGRTVLKKHYGILMVLSMIAVLLGSEFAGSALFLHASDSNIPKDDKLLSKNVLILEDPGIDVFRDIIEGRVIEGVELSDELQDKYATTGNGVLGHTEGVIASLIGTVTSGHLYIKVLQSIFTITQSPRASLIIFVLLAILVYSLFFALVCEPYRITVRRMFLEARAYEKIPFHHFLHLKHSDRWIQASLAIIYADFLYALWFFTIAGAFIKRYSYFMVPYVLAENPDIKAKEAVALSRNMMDGHKMECFKLELSFLGWLILGFATGGILNVFYYVPYKFSVLSEYYARIREDAKAKGLAGTELLDDPYIIEPADPMTLRKAYRELEEEKRSLDDYDIKLTGARRFFAENFAIWLGSMAAKEEYQQVENRRFEITDDIDAASGLAYPDRLDPRFRKNPLVKRIHTDFLRCYSLWNLFSMFFFFSFIGWVWEVVLFIIQTGEFVNRGSLYGPWVPIYGAGGTLILVLLCKLRTRPPVLFLSIVVMCGIIEYATSYFQEMQTGMRYWDYSGYFLNLNGRICAEGLFAFAVLGSMVVYFLAPVFDTMLMRVNNKLLVSVTISLLIIFVSDVVYSHFHPHTGKGITDMGRTEPLTISCERPDTGPSSVIRT